MSATPTDTATDRLAATLREFWGYDGFRPLQREAMNAVVAGRDSLVVLPTGGGKSLCYQAPALCLDGTAVVVSPLLSLMKDQIDALAANGIAAGCLNSMQSPEERHRTTRDLRSGELKLLYVAPERLANDNVFDLLGSIKVVFFAIDEAHCVSTWGHDFRPDYRRLRALKERFPGVAVHGYTATATERVRADVVEQLGLDDAEVLVGSFDRRNLVYGILPRDGDGFPQVEEIVNRHRDQSGIVYAISRKKVEALSDKLNARGHSTRPYHAGLSAEERKANQDAFIADRIHTIVATVAFGMGIDKPDVRYVVHAGMPKSLEAYQQESGRAGRDGLEAECLLLHSGGDVVSWKQMLAKNPNEMQAGAIESLEAMADYTSTLACRHRGLVAHFGQTLAEDCGNACDVCLGTIDLVDDALVIGQKILSSVHRQEQRFGTQYTALVLKGSKDQKVLANGHERLSTYGLLADESSKSILDWIGQLVGQGFLARVGDYNVLKITERGAELLRGNVTPKLSKPVKPTKEKRSVAADSREGVDEGLFEELRKIRADLAAAANVPPYIVFGDTSLLDMARRRPTSEAAFLDMHGVGRKKCLEFGDQFLSAIARYSGEHGLATDVDVEPQAMPAEKSSNPNASALAAFEFFERGASIDEVMAELNRARSTTIGYLMNYLEFHTVTEPTPWVDPATASRIYDALENVGPRPLRPIFEWLNGEDGNPTDRPMVEYDEIKIAAACWANRQS